MNANTPPGQRRPMPRTGRVLEAREVVVTAMAATTSLAGTLDDTWTSLLAGKSGIGHLDAEFLAQHDLPVRIGGRLKVDPGTLLERVERRRMSFGEQLAATLGRRVWSDAGSPSVDPNRLAVSIGTGLGGGEALVDAVDKMRAGGYRKVSPFAVQMVMPNGPAAIVGLAVGAGAGVMTPVSACASGAEAIAQAWRMLAFGDADIMVAGGVEGHIDAVPIASFAMMRALSTRNEDPEGASRPFDVQRDGFVFGEAGALMVLETEDHARARGATIHARLLGAGITSDGYHLVAPDPEGRGAARAITRAIEVAGLSPQDVQHVNAHATSTGIGDLSEACAIDSALGDHAAVYAPKSALGHSVGAAGAIEAALTVLSVREGVIPPTLNLPAQDPAVGLDIVSGEPRYGTIDYAVNNSFGFGGHNVALAFARY